MNRPIVNNGWENAKLVTENWEDEVDKVVQEILKNRKAGINCALETRVDNEFVYCMVRFDDGLEGRIYRRVGNGDV